LEKPFEESWFHAPLHAVGDSAALPAEEAFHMQKVLRLEPGRQVIASNGKGGVFLCTTSPGTDRIGKGESVHLSAIKNIANEPIRPCLNFILSLLKGRDLEDPVEGLCQLNIGAIHLVTTDHTQELKGQNHERQLERLRGKALVALKQAKKSWLTEIHAPIPIREWKHRFSEMTLVLLHPGEDRLPEHFKENLAVLSGPEGGFSVQELEWLKNLGCFTMGLGATRIRGTHAPLLACGKLMGLGWI
jgi:16S rRNA (uracil1498-N3)-methyltransferase